MKNKKILSGLLASILTVGTVTGCALFKNNEEDQNESEETIQYQIYKLAKESGKTELSYEDWLISIKGENGKDGSTWLVGSSTPLVSEGKNGDLYFNSSNQSIYIKDNNVWILKSDLNHKDISFIEKIPSIPFIFFK